jgi:hypothetical protein
VPNERFERCLLRTFSGGTSRYRGVRAVDAGGRAEADLGGVECVSRHVDRIVDVRAVGVEIAAFAASPGAVRERAPDSPT